MKTLQITLLALGILFATSCNKDKNESGDMYRIKQIVFSSSETATYQYNERNQITRIDYSDGTFEKGIYNSSGQLTTYQEGGNPPTDYTVDFIYTSSGLKQEEITSYSTGAKRKVVWTNANGVLTSYKTYSWSGGTWSEDPGSLTTMSYNAAKQQIKTQKDHFYAIYGYDERGNLNSTKQYLKKADNSGFYLSGTSTFTFDNKELIRNGIRQSEFYKNNYIDLVNTGYDEDGMITNQISQTYSYEYNAAGYVTKLYHNGVLHATYTLEKI